MHPELVVVPLDQHHWELIELEFGGKHQAGLLGIQIYSPFVLLVHHVNQADRTVEKDQDMLLVQDAIVHNKVGGSPPR